VQFVKIREIRDFVAMIAQGSDLPRFHEGSVHLEKSRE
jgi:hypothetical protein